ncbi:MAG: cytochrome d ubiquinol oxidase subunit II [Verrucomicrobiota bacterium]
MWTDFFTDYFSLNATWFLLVGILFAGYAILDGFDLGVGMLNLLGKSDHDRRILYNSIGPVWDGNEVWLVTGGGSLFAAFPVVYAGVFSGFYIAFMLLLFCIILRAVAIEFRSKEAWGWWRRTWDYAFFLSSGVSSLLIGVAVGNIVHGVPMDAQGNYTGTFLDLLNPYSLLLGVTTVALFLMHGCIYVVLKTEGDLQNQFRRYVNNFIIFFIICYAITSFATLLYYPHMTDVFKEYPAAGIVALASMLLIANIPREIHLKREFMAFLSSCGAMLALMGVLGLGLFPNLVYGLPDGLNSLTVYNAASSQKTLSIMLLIAVMGVPLVLAYTASVYWIFRGKVVLTPESY